MTTAARDPTVAAGTIERLGNAGYEGADLIGMGLAVTLDRALGTGQPLVQSRQLGLGHIALARHLDECRLSLLTLPSSVCGGLLHGLRHTCGSILLARGVPLIVVSRHLGHADPNITARVYAHLLSDAQLDQAAHVFGSLE